MMKELEIIYLMFQSSFELTGYITLVVFSLSEVYIPFQSSFELTGYITVKGLFPLPYFVLVSKLFRAYRLYNTLKMGYWSTEISFQSSFELTGYITLYCIIIKS